MSVIVYTGRPRSGKTIEVVKEVILTALAAGRRVVTNVSGLDWDEIAAYLAEKRNIDTNKVGLIVHVTQEEIAAPGFFPIFDDHKKVITWPGIVQPGDVFIGDEVWRYWSPDQKITAEHMQFFRLHGQIADPVTGFACEVGLITQDIIDVHRKIKVIVEKTFVMTKLGKFGTPTKYRVDVFGGYRVGGRNSPLESAIRTYDKEIFQLYTSTSHKNGKSVQVDKRGNILNSPLYKIVLPVGLILSIASGKYVWDFLHGDRFKGAKPAATAQAGGPGPGATGAAIAAPVAQAPANIPGMSETWRLAGWFQRGGMFVATLVDGSGRTRVLNPPAWKQTVGSLVVALPEGGFAAEFSGPSVLHLAEGVKK